MKKNFWDSVTGRINYVGIIQAAKIEDKRLVYQLLKDYFAREKQQS